MNLTNAVVLLVVLALVIGLVVVAAVRAWQSFMDRMRYRRRMKARRTFFDDDPSDPQCLCAPGFPGSHPFCPVHTRGVK